MIVEIFKKIRLSLHFKERKFYFDLYNLLGFFPNDVELYERAFSHKSASYDNGKGKHFNNERLEFLGDAILSAVVGDVVYSYFPMKQEGFLTIMRSKLVSRTTLNAVAEKLNLQELVHYKGTALPNSVFGNAFEALVGAIYLDCGFATCKQFIKKRILDNYVDLDEMAQSEFNYKGKVIEWAQRNGVELRFITSKEQKAIDQDSIFRSKIVVEGKVWGRGIGNSKKDSQQEAAKTTLEMFKNDDRFLDTIKLIQRNNRLD